MFNYRMLVLLALEGTCGRYPVQAPSPGRSPGAGDTGTRPGGFGMSPQRETPRPPRAAVPVLCRPRCKVHLHLHLHPFCEGIPPAVQPKPLLAEFRAIPPRSAGAEPGWPWPRPPVRACGERAEPPAPPSIRAQLSLPEPPLPKERKHNRDKVSNKK